MNFMTVWAVEINNYLEPGVNDKAIQAAGINCYLAMKPETNNNMATQGP